MKKTKRLLAILLGLTVVLATSGCIKLNMTLSVTSNDLISGSVVSAISKELADYAAESGQSSTAEPLFPNNPKVTHAPFSDSTWVGDRYTFQSMPISEFNAFGDSSSSLRITRTGDNLTVTGMLDMSTDDGTGDSSGLGIDPSSLFDVRLSITLPGKIKSSTGTISGNTITWKGKYGVPLELSAVTYAPKAKSPAAILPNTPRNLAITEITANSVLATFELPASFTALDLKKAGYYVGYFSTKSGTLLGSKFISSLDGQQLIDGLDSVTERKLTFKIFSKAKKTFSSVKVTLPAGPSTATAVTYKKNSLKNGQITINWKYAALNADEAVSGFVIHVANPKEKGNEQEFEVLDSEARSAVIDGGFAKKNSYKIWIEPKLTSGLKAPNSATINLKL